MGRDDAIGSTQQGIGSEHRLPADHIHSGPLQFPRDQSICHSLLVDQTASGGVDEHGAGPHFRKRMGVDDLVRLREEGTVEAHHMGRCQ